MRSKLYYFLRVCLFKSIQTILDGKMEERIQTSCKLISQLNLWLLLSVPKTAQQVCLGPSCGSAYLHTRLSNLLQSWLCWFSSHFSRTKFYSSLCRQAYCLSKDHIYPFTRSTNWRSPLCNEQKKKYFSMVNVFKIKFWGK